MPRSLWAVRELAETASASSSTSRRDPKKGQKSLFSKGSLWYFCSNAIFGKFSSEPSGAFSFRVTFPVVLITSLSLMKGNQARLPSWTSCTLAMFRTKTVLKILPGLFFFFKLFLTCPFCKSEPFNTEWRWDSEIIMAGD